MRLSSFPAPSAPAPRLPRAVKFLPECTVAEVEAIEALLLARQVKSCEEAIRLLGLYR